MNDIALKKYTNNGYVGIYLTTLKVIFLTKLQAYRRQQRKDNSKVWFDRLGKRDQEFRFKKNNAFVRKPIKSCAVKKTIQNSKNPIHYYIMFLRRKFSRPFIVCSDICILIFTHNNQLCCNIRIENEIFAICSKEVSWTNTKNMA